MLQTEASAVEVNKGLGLYLRKHSIYFLLQMLNSFTQRIYGDSCF